MKILKMNRPYYGIDFPITFLTVAIAICLSLTACRREIPELQGFNNETWKNDPNACNGTRLQYEEVLMAGKDKIFGLTEEQTLAFLGRPDRQDLKTRNQKSYLYFIAPGPACKQGNSPKVMTLRFSAINRVTEVAFEKGNAVNLPQQ